jgi:DNA-binding NarL/FixJ family response regulator
MTEKIIKILIVDDHPAVQEGIKAALQKEPDFDILGTANDGLMAIEMAKSLKPDIVIMDYGLPKLDGLKATKEIKKGFNATKIIIYSMLSDKDLVVLLFKAGISGYVLKGQPISEIIMALKSVAMGGNFYSEAIGLNLQEYLVEDMSHDQEEDVLKVLSSREKEVFLLLADGLTINKIADQLFISRKTVETHKYNILGKLNLKSIAELTKIGIRKKLIKV